MAALLASCRRICNHFRSSLPLRINLKQVDSRIHRREISHLTGCCSIGCLRIQERKRGLRYNDKTHHIYVFDRDIHSSTFLGSELKTVNCPPFAESISEGDIRWEKGLGDTVTEDEVLCEVETDKTSIPVPSPVAGVIETLMVEDGSTVTPGMALAKIMVGAEGSKPAESAKPAAAKPIEEAKPAPVAPAKDVAPKVSPEAVVPRKPASTTLPDGPVVSHSPPKVAPPAPVPSSGGRGETRVKMNRMRQRIATRLKDAQNTTAMLTTFNEIDMGNVMDMRKQYKDLFAKKYNLKLGFMSAFVKAAAFALQDQPVVNAVIDDNEIVYRDYVDISVAVATPKGLVVPVVRNVANMNYADIEKAINELGVKARDGLLAVEDMDGGTFTISNGGVFGSMFGTPIINPPQSAILGMHAIFDRPMAINGQVLIRPMMYVALTYDHRLVDGREAVTFLKKIKSAVEDPRVMLLDL